MGSSSCRRAPQERVSEYRLIASRKGTSLETPPPRSSGLSFIIISRYQTFLFFLNIFSSQTPSLDHFLLLQVISDATNSRQNSSRLTTRRFCCLSSISHATYTFRAPLSASHAIHCYPAKATGTNPLPARRELPATPSSNRPIPRPKSGDRF